MVVSTGFGLWDSSGDAICHGNIMPLQEDSLNTMLPRSSSSSSLSQNATWKSTSFYLIDMTAKLLGMRTADDPQSEFATGQPRLIPQTSVPIPISPNYLANQYDRRVFGAAQQASKYSKVSTFFSNQAEKHYLIAEGAAANAKAAYYQVLLENRLRSIHSPTMKWYWRFCEALEDRIYEKREFLNLLYNSVRGRSNRVWDKEGRLDDMMGDLKFVDEQSRAATQSKIGREDTCKSCRALTLKRDFESPVWPYRRHLDLFCSKEGAKTNFCATWKDDIQALRDQIQ